METRKENQQNDVIDLKELFFIYVKKWWLLLIGALAGAAIAFSVSRFLITPEYESTAMLYVLSKTTSVTSMVDFQLGDALAGDFSVIAKSNPVIDQAVEQIREKTGKNYTRSQVLNMISVNNQYRSGRCKYCCKLCGRCNEGSDGKYHEIRSADNG